jgi:polar amino acid transport system substrate-binding protein
MGTELTRRRLLGLAGAGALGLGATALLGGCGRESADALTRMRSGGSVSIGLSQLEPFAYTDASGRPTGESPEVARAVVTRMGGAGLVAVQVDYDRLIPGLRDGEFDMIAIGMTITPVRCSQVAFSRPDYIAKTALIVPSGNPKGLGTLGGVARTGATLGVLDQGAELEFAHAAGVRDDRITTFPGQSSLFRGVADGRVDTAALTRISLLDEARRNAGSDVEVTAGFYPLVDGRPAMLGGGFAFRQEDTAFREAFDGGLTDLQRSGGWLDVVRPFGLTEDNLPPADLTTAKLCAGTPQS